MDAIIIGGVTVQIHCIDIPLEKGLGILMCKNYHVIPVEKCEKMHSTQRFTPIFGCLGLQTAFKKISPLTKRQPKKESVTHLLNCIQKMGGGNQLRKPHKQIYQVFLKNVKIHQHKG